eukprot:4044676-Pyramimonas_sp.AAC.1
MANQPANFTSTFRKLRSNPWLLLAPPSRVALTSRWLGNTCEAFVLRDTMGDRGRVRWLYSCRLIPIGFRPSYQENELY